MIYNLQITIPDENVPDITEVLSEKYWYKAILERDKEIIIPAVLDQEDRTVEKERIEIEKEEYPNPLNLLEHISAKISADIKGYVIEKKRKDIIDLATQAIDNETITPTMDVTIN